MNISIDDIQKEIIEDFSILDEWDDKYAYIIECGKKLKPLPQEYKNEEHLVRGCQSQVWLHAEHKDGLVYFYAESDAIIVKGLISLLIKVLSGHKAEDIVKSDLYFIDKIGMQSHLSMTRSNGLASMLKTMKVKALLFLEQEKAN
ncbi:MAG: Cysteine desulfuration protein SufE [Chitinophagaceae bacterium]|nr:Cysteine desulfuration protein SufE [Chitinophagaceae bacterium]